MKKLMTVAIALATVLVPVSRGFAQRSGGAGLPQVGSVLPDLRAFDDQGREFSLAELRGEYSVLVFGCLT